MDKDPELINEIKGNKNTILTVKFSPDDRNVIAAGVEGAIYFHKLNQSSYHYKIFAHDDVIYSLDYATERSANVHYFLSGSRDKSVKLWKINQFDKEITKQDQEFEPVVYRAHNNTVRFVNISPLNSSMFCTGSDDKTIKIWSANVPNKRLNTLSSHTNWIRCCKFSRRNADLLASCGDDSTLKLFDLRANGMKGAVLNTPVLTITTAHNRHFTYLDWFPLSEHFIAVSSSNNMIRIFDLRNMARIVQFYRPFNDSVNCLQFHPNGHYLLACSADATSKIINVIEGRLLYTLKGHYKSVFSCAFSSDGSRFLTAGKDKSLKLWQFNLSDGDSDDGLMSSDMEANNLSFEKNSVRRRRANLNVSLNDDPECSTIITSLTNRDKLNRSADSNGELFASRLKPTGSHGGRMQSLKNLSNLSNAERNLNQSLSSVNREFRELSYLNKQMPDRPKQHPAQRLGNLYDPDYESLSLAYEKATNNRIDFKSQRHYPHNHHHPDAHCNHSNHFDRRCKHRCDRSFHFDRHTHHPHNSADHPPGSYHATDDFAEANQSEMISKNKLKEDLLLTNSELNCIFSQLTILESSLTRVERRLLNLEAKLDR